MDANKKPIFINCDGAEVLFDADATVATVGRLNGEAKAHHIAKETAEAALKPTEDARIEDTAAAAEAIVRLPPRRQDACRHSLLLHTHVASRLMIVIGEASLSRRRGRRCFCR